MQKRCAASAVHAAALSGRARVSGIACFGLKVVSLGLVLAVTSGCINGNHGSPLVEPRVISLPAASPSPAAAPSSPQPRQQNTETAPPQARVDDRPAPPPEPDAREPAPASGQGSCDVASYAAAVNQPRSVIDDRTFSRPYRIIEHGEDAPQEHADRITFFLSEGGRIIDISCG
ncbi:hypothetical protein [Roseinatronobacter sp.]